MSRHTDRRASGGFLWVCDTLKLPGAMFYPSASLEENVHPVFLRSGFGRSLMYSGHVFSGRNRRFKVYYHTAKLIF